MKKNIFIYEKDPEILESLRSFFRGEKTLRPEFFSDIDSLREKVSGRLHGCLLCIIPSDEIKKLKPSKSGCPALLTISADARKGIGIASKYGAEGYILKPVCKEDLKFKIINFFNRKNEKARLEKLVITDYLTGIYNIRYFYTRIFEEFSRSERYRLPLSCLMLDIDHFKAINDKYGHKVGDIILRQFAQLLNKHIRKSDVLARYGGEEFIMFFPQTNEKAALLKAESLRSVIENHQFTTPVGKKNLTVSIGVVSYPKSGVNSMDALITSADNALYKAKAMGRNKVVIHGRR